MMFFTDNSQLATRNSSIVHGPSSIVPAGSSVLVVVLRIALVVGLIGAGALAWNGGEARGRYNVARGYKLLNEGRYTQATALLEDTLLSYRDPETRLALSFAYLARRDTARALTQAQLVLDTGRRDMFPAAWAQIGRVLQVESQDSEAFDAWSRAQEAATAYTGSPRIQADARSATWHAAMLHWQRGEWDAARGGLHALLKGPDDAYSRSARVKLAQLLGPGDPGEATRLLAALPGGPLPRSVASPSPASTASAPDMNVPGLAEGLSQAAIDTLAASIRAALAHVSNTGGGEGDTNLFWGAALLQQGEARLAAEYLQRAATLMPRLAQVHAQFGLALLAEGRVDEATTHLKQAAALDPSLPLPHHALAQLYTQQHRWDAALTELNAARAAEPTSPQPLMEFGEFYRQQGRYTEAEDAYKQAAAIQTGLGARQGQADARLVLARFYIDVLGDGCAKGLDPAQQALAAHPGDPDALDAVGWALSLCQKPTEAAATLERAVSAAPTVALYHYHLARVYVQLDRLPDARDQYTRVQDYDPDGPLSARAITDLSRLP